MKRSLIVLVLIGALVISTGILAWIYLLDDAVTLVNTSGAESGIFVSARRGSDFEDRRFPVTVNGSINVGPLMCALRSA